ncbi:MAG: HEAT repeat domain-containing protein [Halobacteriales archaeon]|nr:HEAT repeat domain-containing protein [Halobacteriales archaeon]
MSLYQLSMDGDTETILEYLQQSDEPQLRERAAELLGDLEAADPKVTDELVRVARTDPDDTVTAAAIDALNQIGLEAVEKLIARMTDSDFDANADWAKVQAFVKALSADIPELRIAAANALGELGEANAVPPLVDRLNDTDPRVRERAARSLGILADPRAVDPLIQHLDDEHPRVRREVAEALGAIGSDKAVSALQDLLEDSNESVRRIAIDGLGNLGRPEPIPDLVEALSDPSPIVRRAAVFAIIDLLSNAPADRSHDIRERAVDRLKETDDRELIDTLVEILEESSQTAQRRNTAWLLGRITADAGRRKAVRALIDALEDDDEFTRRFAATSLVEIGGLIVEEELFEVIDDGSFSVDARAQAVFTLGKVGGDRSKERIEDLLETTDEEEIRKQAFSAISKLGGQR